MPPLLYPCCSGLQLVLQTVGGRSRKWEPQGQGCRCEQTGLFGGLYTRPAPYRHHQNRFYETTADESWSSASYHSWSVLTCCWLMPFNQYILILIFLDVLNFDWYLYTSSSLLATKVNAIRSLFFCSTPIAVLPFALRNTAESKSEVKNVNNELLRQLALFLGEVAQRLHACLFFSCVQLDSSASFSLPKLLS